MNTQAIDITKAVTMLQALKDKTRRPSCATMQAQADSYDYERDITFQAVDIVADLLNDLCLGAASLGEDNNSSSFREYFIEALTETVGECLSKADLRVEEIREEFDLEQAA